MLRWFDEADLAAALAPKPLLLAGVTDKHGEPLSSGQIHGRFAWPKTCFTRLGQSDALRLVSDKPSYQSLARWLKSLN